MVTKAWSYEGKGYAKLLTKGGREIKLEFYKGEFTYEGKKVTNESTIEKIKLCILRYLESLDYNKRVILHEHDGSTTELWKTRKSKANCYMYKEVTAYAGMAVSTKTFARLIKIVEEEKRCQDLRKQQKESSF